jgi:hypothetical protein
MSETRSRFVHPQERVLTLPNGDTLTVRRRLTAGEQMDMFERLYLPNKHANGNGRVQLNPVQTGYALIVAYLLDWSLVDESGARVVIRGEPAPVIEAAVRQLDPDDFNEIKTAIEAHESEVDAERARKKKGTPTGGDASNTISASPSGATGASSGSES